jgi:hypothetical protein
LRKIHSDPYLSLWRQSADGADCGLKLGTESATQKEIIMRISDLPEWLFQEGMLVKHWKGGIYRIQGVAHMASSKYPDADGAVCVRYVRIIEPDGSMCVSSSEYIRPAAEFVDMKTWIDENGEEFPAERFRPIHAVM